MTAYFDMGGYAGFVWPAYAVAAAVMVGLLVASWRAMRTCEKQLKVLQESRPNPRRAVRMERAAEEATGADA